MIWRPTGSGLQTSSSVSCFAACANGAAFELTRELSVLFQAFSMLSDVRWSSGRPGVDFVCCLSSGASLVPRPRVGAVNQALALVVLSGVNDAVCASTCR